MKKLESCDMVIVWELDRLGRSLRDLKTILDDLKSRGENPVAQHITPKHRNADRPHLGVIAESSPNRTLSGIKER